MESIRRVSRHYNLQLFCASGLIAISSMNYGFDNTGFSSTQAITSFIRQFGEYDPKTKKYAIPPYFLSLMNSLVFIGFAIGLYIGSIISARYGRRMIMFVMSIWALICAALIISAKSKEQMLASRILNYVYIGMENSVIGNFQAELVPREVRGFAVGSYQMSLGLGGIIVGIICNFTRDIPNNHAWQIPMAVYFLIPTIVVCGVWFIPESPRWLASKGRIDEARRSLERVRVDRSPEKIEEELNTIILGLERETSQRGDYKDLFKGTNARRTTVVYVASLFVQLTGQAFVSNYGAVFYRSIGVANPFALTASTSALMTTAVFLNMFLVDLTGRRNILMFASCLQSLCVFMVGGLGLRGGGLEIRKAIVGFNMLFGFSYGLGWGPAHWVVTAEMPEQRMRDKTTRTAGFIVIFCNFLVSFTIPYLLYEPYAALGPKVGFIFGPICAIGAIWVYFFLPETKGRSLEEIDRMFAEHITAIKSSKWHPPPLVETDEGPAKLAEVAMEEVQEVEKRV